MQCDDCGYEFSMREIQSGMACPQCKELQQIDDRAEQIKKEKQVLIASRSAKVNSLMKDYEGATPTVVIDVNIGFVSLVVLFVKAAIALIPAILILMLFAYVVVPIFVGLT